jgi:hypothetical protein
MFKLYSMGSSGPFTSAKLIICCMCLNYDQLTTSQPRSFTIQTEWDMDNFISNLSENFSRRNPRFFYLKSLRSIVLVATLGGFKNTDICSQYTCIHQWNLYDLHCKLPKVHRIIKKWLYKLWRLVPYTKTIKK